jgi:hypothetical protein
MSLVESLANVVIGYAIAVATQAAVFPLFGLQASLTENVAIGGPGRAYGRVTRQEWGQSPQLRTAMMYALVSDHLTQDDSWRV